MLTNGTTITGRGDSLSERDPISSRLSDVQEYALIPITIALAKHPHASSPSIETFLSTVIPAEEPCGPLNRFLFSGMERSCRLRLRGRLEAIHGEITSRDSAPTGVSPRIFEAVSVASAIASGDPTELTGFIRNGSLAQTCIPWLNEHATPTSPLLECSIPPHLGHGVGRTAALLPPEVQREMMQSEAEQDRRAAAALFRSLSSLLTSPSIRTLEGFFSTLSGCGDWLHCITHHSQSANSPQHQAVARFLQSCSRESLLGIGSVYEELFLGRPPGICTAHPHWFEVSRLSDEGPPSRIPLLAAAVAIAGR